MATFDVISEKAAPRPRSQPSPFASRMSEYEGYVTGLRKGAVGKLTPSPSETARGVSMRVSRAARRARRSVETWTVDGAVYFRATM